MNHKNCPVCHSAIPENAPGGLCPACVLRDADEQTPKEKNAPSIEEISTAFPKFEVLEFIGQGGMGSVYKVRQPSLDRIVALKILSPELGSDPAFAERFAREARVLGKLNHPNIVTVFEHGESGGFFYLMMEFVDGVNLRQAMKAGRFTPEQALAIVPGVCDALQAAHEQGVWHRDIKPENILLDSAGGVKIADFGIARIIGDPHRDFTLTMTGNALGSVAYMSPEQHEAPHSVDHRADIFSLGVVIYEMLTGELPLGRFPAPSERSSVDARIDEIVLKTLEKERERRQQSATAVKTEMQTAAQGESNPPPHSDSSPATSSRKKSGFFAWPRELLVGGITATAVGIFTAPMLFGLGVIAIVLGLSAYIWPIIHDEANKTRNPEGVPAVSSHHTFRLFAWSLGLLLGGITGAMVGGFPDPLIAGFSSPLIRGLGFIAAVLGLTACGWILYQIREGQHPKQHRLPLLILVFWPAVLTLTFFSAVLWILNFKTPMDAPWRIIAASPFVYLLLAISLPLLAAKALWHWFGKDPDASSSRKFTWIQVTVASLLCILTTGSAKWMGEQAKTSGSYTATVLKVSGDFDIRTVRDAAARAVGDTKGQLRMKIFEPGAPTDTWTFADPKSLHLVLESAVYRSGGRARAKDIFSQISRRLKASLPGALKVRTVTQVGEGTGGKAQMQAMLVPLGLIPAGIIFLAAGARRRHFIIVLVSGLATAVLVSAIGLPVSSEQRPPTITDLEPLPDLPPLDYDFSTTRKAIESMIKAAKVDNEKEFKRGVSAKLLAETSDWEEPMADWKNRVYRGLQSRDGNRAIVKIRDGKKVVTELQMVKENYEWKISQPQ